MKILLEKSSGKNLSSERFFPDIKYKFLYKYQGMFPWEFFYLRILSAKYSVSEPTPSLPEAYA